MSAVLSPLRRRLRLRSALFRAASDLAKVAELRRRGLRSATDVEDQRNILESAALTYAREVESQQADFEDRESERLRKERGW